LATYREVTLVPAQLLLFSLDCTPFWRRNATNGRWVYASTEEEVASWTGPWTVRGRVMSAEAARRLREDVVRRGAAEAERQALESALDFTVASLMESGRLPIGRIVRDPAPELRTFLATVVERDEGSEVDLPESLYVHWPGIASELYVLGLPFHVVCDACSGERCPSTKITGTRKTANSCQWQIEYCCPAGHVLAREYHLVSPSHPERSFSGHDCGLGGMRRRP